MAVDTGIHWCDDTVNPTMGCDGCELWDPAKGGSCYAATDTANKKGKRGYPVKFENVTFFEGRLETMAAKRSLAGRSRVKKEWLNGMPRIIFVSNMGDSLSKAVPFVYLEREIIDVVKGSKGQRHIWLWLTKRPERMAEFSDWLQRQGRRWPANLWPGTSVTSSTKGHCDKRIEELLKVGNERTTRWLSVEPLWSAVDLTPWLPSLDWVIVGGESGSNAKPFELEWARRIRDDCREHGVPFFLKQLGRHPVTGLTVESKPLQGLGAHGSDWSLWPDDLKVREVPPACKQVPANCAA